MANATVSRKGIQLVLDLTEEEASWLAAMTQNGDEGEEKVAENVRRAIFEALRAEGY